MATREYYFSRATAEATTTATAYTNTATLSFTPSDNQSYALFWSVQAQHDDLTTDIQIDLRQSGPSATLAAANSEAHDVTSYINYGGLALATFATATGSHTFNIRFGNETATNSSRARNSGLTAVRLDTADQFVESLDTVTTTSTAAFQTVATFSFTPSATGNYLIIGGAEWCPGATTGIHSDIRLQIGGTGTNYGMASSTYQDETTFRTWMNGTVLGLTASQWDFSIDVLGATTSLTKTRRHRFLALRSDGFETLDFTEQRSQTVSTTTSSATVASLSATTAAHECLVIGSNMSHNGSAAVSVLADFLEDGVVENSQIEEPNVANADHPGVVTYSKAFTAAAHGFRWGVYSSGANFARMDEAIIAVIDLEGTAAVAGTIIPQIMESYRRRRLY